MTELTADLLPTVSRLAAIAEQKATLDAEEKRLKAALRASLSVGDRLTVNGNPVLALQPNRRFSADLAEQVLPAELLALCTVTKVDSAAAKKTLPPAVYEQCMAEAGEPKVVLL